jgi:hypothetical protein
MNSFKIGGDGGTGVYMREGTTSRVMAANMPFGEFYDFYSVSSEYFRYTLACSKNIGCNMCMDVPPKYFIMFRRKKVLMVKLEPGVHHQKIAFKALFLVRSVEECSV